MRRAWKAGMVMIGLLTPAAAAAQVEPAARAVVERAVEAMGGEAALRGVERVRLDMMTQWQRTRYDGRPAGDRPSFEPHTDVRDYTIPAWRNTREFGPRRIVNVVRDSVAITDLGNGFQTQSVAYVDERDELFVYTPDRLMLRALDAPSLTLGADTTLAGERYRQVRARLDGRLAVTIAFHAGTGLPAVLRFRQGHPNDFGLVPFGAMEVEVAYAGWQSSGGIHIPTQWDIARAGSPYKRMTVQRVVFNPDFPADSFAVSDSLRHAFVATRAPMHDRPVDSVTVATDGLVQVHGFGFPAGALRVGEAWLLLEAGHAPLSLERGREALARSGVPAPTGALVVGARPGNGGVVSLVREGIPVWTSRAAAPFLDVMLANEGVPARNVTVVAEGTWVELGGARVRLEPVDLPDVHGSLLLWSPTLRWLWAPDAITPLDLSFVRAAAAAHGWDVRAVGTPRGLWVEEEGGGGR